MDGYVLGFKSTRLKELNCEKTETRKVKKKIYPSSYPAKHCTVVESR
jgi:hypothetical protein